jgi:hypothetical protein
MTTILITGARAPVAQDLARACRATGMTVHLADSVMPWAARMLQPRFPIHRLPPPRQAFPAFRAALSTLVDATGADLILPTCEEIFWIAEAAQRDGHVARLFAPPPALLRRLHSKALFPQLARELGLDAPETHVVASRDDLGRVPIEPAALVLEPEFSRFGSHVKVAPNDAAIARIEPTSARRWVAQRRIIGEEISSWAAIRAGAVTAFAAYRPRWRHGRTAAYQLEAVDLPAVRRITDRIAEATAMSGHLSFDVLVDRDGRAWPVECNPRAVSGLHLFDASPGLGRAIIEDGPCLTPPAGRPRHLAPAMLLLGVPAALREGRLGALLVDWRAGRDVIGRSGDRLALVGSLVDAARFAWTALRAGRSATAATTADIEWDGEPIP